VLRPADRIALRVDVEALGEERVVGLRVLIGKSTPRALTAGSGTTTIDADTKHSGDRHASPA